jgi:hypothetical protein
MRLWAAGKIMRFEKTLQDPVQDDMVLVHFKASQNTKQAKEWIYGWLNAGNCLYLG